MSRLSLVVEVDSKVAETEAEPLLEEPRKYKVFLLNDDYTPMEFVVEVLKRFFHMSETVATQVMLQIHLDGRAVCGFFTRDVADTKVVMVNDYARVNQHPLLCGMEPG